MSNHLAIASATVAIRRLLYSAVTADLGTSVPVSTGRPDTATAGSTVGMNLFLYHVSFNPHLRNDELPVRRSDASVANRPRLALDLHYLLTCFGEETTWTPQRVLGSAMRALHTWPVLTRSFVLSALDEERDGDTSHPLADADLDQQVELVRISPLSLNLEELSKLWSVFFQTPYALSVAYQASVVLIDAATSPEPVLPVRTVQLFALPKPIIQLESVESSEGRDEPVLASSTIVLRGKGLKGDSTWVRLAGEDWEPTSVSPTRITLDLTTIPAASLRAGVQAVQVVHYPVDEDGDRLAYGFESNAVGVAIRPELTVPTTGSVSSLALTVSPELEKSQRIKLYLYGATSYAFDAPVTPATGEDTTDTITFTLGDGVAPGDYLVRLQVDGAQSLLDTDAGGGFTGPEVSLS